MSVTWGGQSVSINTGATGSPVGAAGGDLDGAYPNPTVDGLQGRPVASTAPTAGQALVWSGTAWAPGSVTAAVADNTYGDITVSSSGTVWTINAAAVTNAKLRDSAGLSVIGRSANSTGTVADIAAASDNQVLRRSGSALGFGTVATGGIANNAVTYQKMQNCTAHHLLGRASGNGQIQEIVATAYGQSLLDDADAATARTTLGLGSGDSPTFTQISLQNGEYIRNSTNGRMDFIAHPGNATNWGVYFDMTSNQFWVKLGTINSSTFALNPVGFLLDAPMSTAANVALGFNGNGGEIAYYTGTGNETWQFSPLGGAGRSMAMAIVSKTGLGGNNRRPVTAHVDPTLYVYAAGNANANDFVRVNHDATNGTVEAGRGVLTLVGASGVRMNGGFGFGTAPTAVQTGYTTFANLTTDRTCDADATSTAELADILGTLIQDLKAKGIISA